MYVYINAPAFISGWVYPVASHWAWSDIGWMKFINCNGTNVTDPNTHCFGYKDFAGGGVVHLFSGLCAVIACYFIGPRKGRFMENGKPADMPGHSIPLSAAGGFILLFGFLAFNGGSLVGYFNKHLIIQISGF